jgi:hypothetical protein
VILEKYEVIKMSAKNKIVITKEKFAVPLSFEVVSAEYCSKLYPKETRLQRTRKFIREELDPKWEGTFRDLLIKLNRHIQTERLSVSGDDLREVLAEDGGED